MMLAGRGPGEGDHSRPEHDADQRAVPVARERLRRLGFPVVILLVASASSCSSRSSIRRTALGMMIESIGINAEASRLAGLNRRALLILCTWRARSSPASPGIFATGTVMTVDVSQTGYQLELDAILAVVIGGTTLAGGKFSLGGAAIGCRAHRHARQDRGLRRRSVVGDPGVQGDRDRRALRRCSPIVPAGLTAKVRGLRHGRRSSHHERPRRSSRATRHVRRITDAARPNRPSPAGDLRNFLGHHRDAASTGAGTADLRGDARVRPDRLRAHPAVQHGVEPAHQQLPPRHLSRWA